MALITTRHKRLKFGFATILLLGALSFRVLITLDNPLTMLYRIRISETNARVITGPNPVEDDFRLLKQNGVNTIVSLLDPNLPYERVLLEREREMAGKFGMRLLEFPMTRLFGQRLNSDYDQRVAKATDAITRETGGKIYVHCYLGMHRTRVVIDNLKARGIASDAYLVRQGERSATAKQLDRAQEAFDAGRYQEVLQILRPSPNLDAKAAVLLAWADYRTGNIPVAREMFLQVLQASPDSDDAHNGKGYCDLRDGNLDAAEKEFSAVLQRDQQDAAALVGMGFVRHRQGKVDEAARYLQDGLKADPNNAEAHETLSILKR